MPCRTIEEQRAHQKDWIKRRRQQKIREFGGICVRCGSTNDLEFDHIDASTKTIQVKHLLSLRQTRLDVIAEWAKCQLLCNPCHKRKTWESGDSPRGEACTWAKLTSEKVIEMRLLQKQGSTYRSLADLFGVDLKTAWRAVNGHTWKSVAVA